MCLVKKTSESDKQLLVRWIFAALSQHPAVKDLAKVSKEQGDQLNHDVGALYSSLMVDRCGTETRDAMQYEGSEALKASFEVLGRVATQGLMTDEKVGAYMADLEKYVDVKALDATAPEKAPEKAPAKP